MTTHLRRGLERLKQFYIKKLESTDLFYTPVELQSLTVSELEILYKKSMSSNK
ncbi:hypothetical protein [Neobacillus cucumis]|uniref:hypothetical protein n=1 Tax=Neobacillus cucumis TaxID=1740721 RepID=UPI0019623840|nr:hypothetical protein [Neobacillus cucumis]MBM7650761.1 hypothetical protein [Neobacillus cucumis]MDR4945599.1 hypothetical protein [Neobacillus cucumis]MED4225190.1 hypothetical protein [Neobacillus cucumis]